MSVFPGHDQAANTITAVSNANVRSRPRDTVRVGKGSGTHVAGVAAPRWRR